MEYDEDPKIREDQIKNNLLVTSIDPDCGKRPSVETSLHEIIPYPFVVHTHPTMVNASLCSQKAEEKVNNLFGSDVVLDNIPTQDTHWLKRCKKVSRTI